MIKSDVDNSSTKMSENSVTVDRPKPSAPPRLRNRSVNTKGHENNKQLPNKSTAVNRLTNTSENSAAVDRTKASAPASLRKRHLEQMNDENI